MSKNNYEKYAEAKQQELLHTERSLLQAISCLRCRQKFTSLQCMDSAIDFVADLYDLSIDEVKRAMDGEEYMKYHKDIGDCENIYYLLTPATILSGCSYKTVLYIDDNDLPNYTLCSSIMAVRPFFVLKSDIYVF